MKILLLMPCDEQHTHAATAIYKALPKEVKEITFAMPMFMEYLTSTKLVGNWIMAFYDSLVSAENVYKTAVSSNDDLIIIGNVSKDNCSFFDAIFNCQDIEESLDYQDNFLDKIKEIVAEDEKLSKRVANMYDNSDSKLALHNCAAIADFLSAYLKTDAKLEEIEKHYKKKLKELNMVNGTK